jgi:hypothetical protein
MMDTDEACIVAGRYEELSAEIGTLTKGIRAKCRADRISGLDELLRQRHELIISAEEISRSLLPVARRLSRTAGRAGISLPGILSGFEERRLALLTSIQRQDQRIRNRLEKERDKLAKKRHDVSEQRKNNGLYGQRKKRQPQYVSMAT